MSDVAERLERSLKSVLISALLASRADVLATALRAGEHLDDAGLPPWTLRCGPGVVEYLPPRLPLRGITVEMDVRWPDSRWELMNGRRVIVSDGPSPAPGESSPGRIVATGRQYANGAIGPPVVRDASGFRELRITAPETLTFPPSPPDGYWIES